MNCTVKAYWTKGVVGWLIANTIGRYEWESNLDNTTTWYFENTEDAVAFKLRFGL